MPLHFLPRIMHVLDYSNVCESRAGVSLQSAAVSARRRYGESSWARRGPEGRVKAARRFTIAPQQGGGDWKTSIWETGMGVKWLGPISPGVHRPRKCIYEREELMMTGIEASVRGGCRKLRPPHKSLLQFKKHASNKFCLFRHRTQRDRTIDSKWREMGGN